MNQDGFTEFVNRVKWQPAKSMPQIPHEYTLVKNLPAEGRDDFLQACIFIKENAKPERFYKRTYYYVRSGQHKYWIMSSNPIHCILINRALI